MTHGPNIDKDPEAYLAELERGFITCAIWSDAYDPDEPDAERGTTSSIAEQSFGDVTAESRSHVLEFCSHFMLEMRYELGIVAELNDSSHRSEYTDAELAGHDLWLTCGGHGAGFWDREYGVAGDRLSDWCRKHGSSIEFGMSPYYEGGIGNTVIVFDRLWKEG